MPGGNLADAVGRAAQLDAYRAEIGRDPAFPAAYPADVARWLADEVIAAV